MLDLTLRSYCSLQRILIPLSLYLSFIFNLPPMDIIGSSSKPELGTSLVSGLFATVLSKDKLIRSKNDQPMWSESSFQTLVAYFPALFFETILIFSIGMCLILLLM